MPHAFDSQSLATLAERLLGVLGGARDHERQLTRLVDMIEAADHPTVINPTDAVPSTAVLNSPMTPVVDLHQRSGWLSQLRALCIEARQQREIAEALAISLVGESVDRDRPASDRRRVLVVDDSQDSRGLAATVLEALGLEVTTATNGLEGVLFAHYGQPVVILMDITMPVLDGFEAARLLKASPTTRHSHVVAYTAQPAYCEGPLRRFFVDVVAKPATPDLIVRKVQRVLDEAPPVDQ
jgi:two-component system, cell cycle response regulator DivK